MSFLKAKFTASALAYLKPVIPNDGTPATRLEHSDSPVCRPYAEGLLVFYLVDAGTDYRYVQYKHLEEDGISESELHDIGLRNLADLVCKRTTRVQPYGDIYAVLMGGDFEASLLLLDELWDGEFRQFVRGDYAAAIPCRDILSFCDSSSPQAIEELKQVISRSYPSGDHLISDKIYVRRGTKWRPGIVEPSS
jgi:uncharacterized protein YtpQ (UPF0354 family)